MQASNKPYGVNDNSYQTAGGLDGITALVNAFYDNMSTLTVAGNILAMHPSDLTQSRTKLAYFLSGWLGGPKLYSQHFGSISIPGAHRHLSVTGEQRDAWLHCMQLAIDTQAYEQDFKDYLITQLQVPAERIVVAGNK